MHYSQINMESIQASPFGNRLDAEFYLPRYLTAEETINQKGYHSLREITTKIDVGHVGPMVNEYTHDGVWLLQTQNVREFFLSGTKMTYISSKFHNHLVKSKVKKNDILIARSGSFGVASILLDSREVNSADVIIIRCLEGKINPCFLVTYLNCKYGVNQLIRFASGGLQGHVNLTILEHLKVCNVSKNIQEYIELVIHKSYSVLNESNLLFSQAQHLLLNELGLIDWNPKHSLSFVKKYSDTQHADRIDADYFQPKYLEIEESIRNYSGGWDTLGNLMTVKKCIEVGSNEYLGEGIPFVRVSNLSPFEITEDKYISEDTYEAFMQHQPEQGEILLSKDASPGIAYHLRDQPKKMIPSGGILRLKRKTEKINNEYLTLVLNSILITEQANRDMGGSVILHWRPDQVKETTIPILPETKQAQIQQKMIECFNLRNQSKHLLKCAKRSVEIAIEQDEQTAIDWLDNNAECG